MEDAKFRHLPMVLAGSLLSVLGFAAITYWAIGGTTPPLPGVSARVQPLGEEDHAAEPTSIRVLVENDANQSIVIVEGWPGLPSFTLNVERDGQGVPLTEYGERQRGNKYRGSRRAAVVRPGETYATVIPVGRYFDLSQPGEYAVSVKVLYTIQGRRDGHATESDRVRMKVASNAGAPSEAE